jgi:hypothetical protein
MKMKHASILAAVVVASFGVTSAHAIQKHDPIFQKTYDHSGIKDPNVVREVRYQDGSPKRKPDLYVAAFAPGTDRDLVREIRYQNGAPKWKSDQKLGIAPPR